MKKAIGLVIITTLLSGNLFANKYIDGKRVYETKRVTNDLVIDGLLDDEPWNLVKWQSEFKQSQPYDGNQPSQETSFKILYDDNNLYVGIRAFDTNPDSIETRMTRRDMIDGDFAGIQVDSYFDLRTAFTFLVSAAGVKMDMIMTNDGQNEDMTWDPIWYVQTNIDAEGWTAEMRIPLSQLRFDKKGSQTWGLQVARMLFRKEELS
ncbi:MAG: carbohydrate binding family 9 domain-containing protein, partial [Bacteroidales bacterium]|nr:carbohydrate binding family 9 domain-containing protein [Bacteroidales bacterium]